VPLTWLLPVIVAYCVYNVKIIDVLSSLLLVPLVYWSIKFQVGRCLIYIKDEHQ